MAKGNIMFMAIRMWRVERLTMVLVLRKQSCGRKEKGRKQDDEWASRGGKGAGCLAE